MHKLALAPVTLAAILAPTIATQDAEPDEPPVGVRLAVASQVRPGMEDQAGSLAHRIVFYENTHFPDWRTRGYQSYSVNFETLYMTLDLTSMTALEDAFDTQNQDEAMRGFQAEFERYFQSDQNVMRYLLPLRPVERPLDTRRFHWQRTTRATFGKYAQAVDHARAVADYVNEHYAADTRMEIFAAFFDDNLGEIHWTADYVDSEAWRATREKLWADPRYVELMAGADTLYDDAVWDERLAWRL